MRPRGQALLLALLGAAVLASAVPHGLPAGFPVRADATTASLAILSNRTSAGRGDAILLTVWINVTGGGPIQWTWLNLSFSEIGGPSVPAIDLNENLASAPAACVATSNLTWECQGLRGGFDYLWALPAQVRSDSWVGRAENVTATAVNQDNAGYSSLTQSVQVWIAGAVFDLRVTSDPAASAAAGELLQFNVVALNRRIDSNDTGLINESTAHDIALTVVLGSGLRLSPDGGGLTLTEANLTPGSSISISIGTIVAENVTPGSIVGVSVVLQYEDFNGYPLTLTSRSSPVYVHAQGVLSPTNVVAAAAIGLSAIVATLVALYYVGQRKIIIDEAFLMHKSGTLIQHASRVASIAKDDDLVASMFVSIQEFVRDSFQSQALLDGVSFGGRRAAVVRGEHVILAAVLSRGDVNYLFPQMVAAVNAVEATYGKLLANWDGRMTKLVGVKGIMNRLLRGGYRAAWKASIS